MRIPHNYIHGVLGIICGIVLLFISLSLPWIKLDIADGLGPERTLSVLAKTWEPILNALMMTVMCGIIVQFLLKGKLIYGVNSILILVEIIIIAVPVRTLFSAPQKLISHSRQLHIFSERYVITHLTMQVIGPIITTAGGALMLLGTLVIMKYPRKQQKYAKSFPETHALHAKDMQAESTDESTGIILPAESLQAGEVSFNQALDNAAMWQAMDAGIDFTDPNAANSSSADQIEGFFYK